MQAKNSFKRLFYLLFIILLLGSCGKKNSDMDFSGMDDDELMKKANELAQKFIIVDGHIDLPYRMKVRNFRLEKEWIDISGRTEEGEFDYVRAKEGGLDSPFMSIYIPATYQETQGKSKEFADSLINLIEGICQLHPDKFALANGPDDIRKNFEKGLISLPMGMENGAGIEDDLSNVAYFHGRGIRYITLTHSKANLICDSSYDTTRIWNGLSPFGEEVVLEMNRVGIMVDVSHISDSAFYDVMRVARAPVIASHSSCRTYTPGFERNMSDEMIKVLAENGGVIQINFGSNFLDEEVSKLNEENRSRLIAILDSAGVSWRDSTARPIIEEFRRDNKTLFADVETVAKHIDHVVQLVGIDHVGFGSDFDGVGDTLPTGLKDVSKFPNLIFQLLKKGYSEEDIEKICYKNVFRVWNEVEQIAATF